MRGATGVALIEVYDLR